MSSGSVALPLTGIGRVWGESASRAPRLTSSSAPRSCDVQPESPSAVALRASALRPVTRS